MANTDNLFGLPGKSDNKLSGFIRISVNIH